MIRINCFGQLSVLRDGVLLPPGAIQPRRMGLLALLASAGDRAQGREGLASLLWPESDDERARGSLAQALYALRRDLGGEDAIQGVREIRLNPEFIDCDLWDFEVMRASGSLEKAVELYNGPLLEGFQLPGLAEFDRWREGERQSWATRHLEVVERLASDAEKKNDRAAAVRWWKKAAAQEPHNARLTIRLMRAMAKGGDRAGAVRQAEIYVALLERDLELAPDPAVLKEAEAIRKAETPSQVTEEHPVQDSGVRSQGAGTFPAEHLDTKERPAIVLRSTDTFPAVTPGAARSRSSARKTAGLVALTAAVVTPLALWLTRAPAKAPPAARRVLVAPLVNSTGDTTFSLVGPMVAEWLTRGLSETGLVEVIDSRTMLESTRDADEASLRDIALGAGVGTLVVGTVYREADSLRIDVRLTDPTTGKLEGAAIGSVYAPVSRPTAALPLLRQKVTGAFAQLFDLEMPNRTATTSHPPTWEAYQEFILGMRDFGVDWDSTLRHFLKAKQIDTTYWTAALWAGNASSNARRYPISDSIFRSLAAIREKLAPYDQASLDYFEGGFVRGDWERSYEGAKRMYALAPGAVHAVFALGNTAQIVGRPREAIDILKTIDLTRGWGTAWKHRILSTIARAQHRIPDFEAELSTGRQMRESDEGMGWLRLVEIRALAGLGRKSDLLRRIDNAMSLPTTTTTWEPFSPGEMLVIAARETSARGDNGLAAELYARAERWYLALPVTQQEEPATRRAIARVLVAQTRYGEAGSLYEALLHRDSTTSEHWGGLAITAAHLGDSAKAVAILEQLRSDRNPYRFGAPAVWASRVAVALGRRQEAISLLHQAIRGGFTRVYLIRGEAEFARLRGFGPFEDILKPRG